MKYLYYTLMIPAMTAMFLFAVLVPILMFIPILIREKSVDKAFRDCVEASRTVIDLFI